MRRRAAPAWIQQAVENIDAFDVGAQQETIVANYSQALDNARCFARQVDNCGKLAGHWFDPHDHRHWITEQFWIELGAGSK